MSDRSDTPTAAEWKILKVVADKGACAARDVVDATGDTQGWSSSTVRTLLRRLVEKGHLQTTRVGNSFLYSPTLAAGSALHSAADELMENAGDKAVGPLLAYMVERSRLSEDEVERLRGILEKRG